MREITIPIRGGRLAALLHKRRGATAIVVVLHGTGVDRHDARNRRIVARLSAARFATLQPELLDPREAVERHDAFDIELQCSRLLEVLAWLRSVPWARGLPLGLFASDIGASVALLAAAKRPNEVGAVVLGDGRPDCCPSSLWQVRAATLLLVEQDGWPYRQVYESLRGEKEMRVLPDGVDLFGEPASVDAVAEHAARWFSRYLVRASPQATPHAA
jgi:putative phosphoribosyl transferase